MSGKLLDATGLLEVWKKIKECFIQIKNSDGSSGEPGQVLVKTEEGTHWQNLPGGILPQVIITAEPGSTVTVTNAGETLNPVERDGVWKQDIPYFSTWTVNASLGEKKQSLDVEVAEVKQYNVAITYFTAAINIISPEDSIITCALGGDVKTIVSSGQDTVRIYKLGTYTITRNKDGKIAERDVVVTEDGQVVQVVLSWRYGYCKTKKESNPEARITYLYDAVGMTPAHMDFSAGSFDYGDWEDVFFVKKNVPVMLKYDCTVDYELDHDDQTKKLGGGDSDISNIAYNGNAMSALPLCWFYRYEDEEYEYEIVCEHRWDEHYKAYAHTRADGSIADYFYWGMFEGSGDPNKMRSLSGKSLLQNATAYDYIKGATANGPGWYIHTWSQRQYIQTLLVLIGKSTDSQSVFGSGNFNKAIGVINTTPTGTLSGKGQFYGNKEDIEQVKVFYIEGLWGNQSIRTAGLIDNKGTLYYKMTPEEGGYRIDDVEGYTNSGISISLTNNFGYINGTTCGEFGCIPTTAYGSDNTFECDGIWAFGGSNHSTFAYALCGHPVSREVDSRSHGIFGMSMTLEPSKAQQDNGCGLSAEMPKEE